MSLRDGCLGTGRTQCFSGTPTHIIPLPGNSGVPLMQWSLGQKVQSAIFKDVHNHLIRPILCCEEWDKTADQFVPNSKCALMLSHARRWMLTSNKGILPVYYSKPKTDHMAQFTGKLAVNRHRTMKRVHATHTWVWNWAQHFPGKWPRAETAAPAAGYTDWALGKPHVITTHIISFNPHNHPLRWGLLPSFYKWQNPGHS